MTKTEMLTAYCKNSASHAYALGFVHSRELYVVVISFEELTRYCKLDRASSAKGGFAKIRIKMTSAEKAELAQTAEKLGSEDLLTEDPKHNRGENFERVLTERWTTETWVKDSIPFNAAGDVKVNGVNIQIKLNMAELTNERILGKLIG